MTVTTLNRTYQCPACQCLFAQSKRSMDLLCGENVKYFSLFQYNENAFVDNVMEFYDCIHLLEKEKSFTIFSTFVETTNSNKTNYFCYNIFKTFISK